MYELECIPSPNSAGADATGLCSEWLIAAEEGAVSLLHFRSRSKLRVPLSPRTCEVLQLECWEPCGDGHASCIVALLATGHQGSDTTATATCTLTLLCVQKPPSAEAQLAWSRDMTAMLGSVPDRLAFAADVRDCAVLVVAGTSTSADHHHALTVLVLGGGRCPVAPVASQCAAISLSTALGTSVEGLGHRGFGGAGRASRTRCLACCSGTDGALLSHNGGIVFVAAATTAGLWVFSLQIATATTGDTTSPGIALGAVCTAVKSSGPSPGVTRLEGIVDERTAGTNPRLSVAILGASCLAEPHPQASWGELVSACEWAPLPHDTTQPLTRRLVVVTSPVHGQPSFFDNLVHRQPSFFDNLGAGPPPLVPVLSRARPASATEVLPNTPLTVQPAGGGAAPALSTVAAPARLVPTLVPTLVSRTPPARLVPTLVSRTLNDVCAGMRDVREGAALRLLTAARAAAVATAAGPGINGGSSALPDSATLPSCDLSSAAGDGEVPSAAAEEGGVLGLGIRRIANDLAGADPATLGNASVWDMLHGVGEALARAHDATAAVVGLETHTSGPMSPAPAAAPSGLIVADTPFRVVPVPAVQRRVGPEGDPRHPLLSFVEPSPHPSSASVALRLYDIPAPMQQPHAVSPVICRSSTGAAAGAVAPSCNARLLLEQPLPFASVMPGSRSLACLPHSVGSAIVRCTILGCGAGPLCSNSATAPAMGAQLLDVTIEPGQRSPQLEAAAGEREALPSSSPVPVTCGWQWRDLPKVAGEAGDMPGDPAQSPPPLHPLWRVVGLGYLASNSPPLPAALPPQLELVSPDPLHSSGLWALFRCVRLSTALPPAAAADMAHGRRGLVVAVVVDLEGQVEALPSHAAPSDSTRDAGGPRHVKAGSVAGVVRRGSPDSSALVQLVAAEAMAAASLAQASASVSLRMVADALSQQGSESVVRAGGAGNRGWGVETVSRLLAVRERALEALSMSRSQSW